MLAFGPVRRGGVVLKGLYQRWRRNDVRPDIPMLQVIGLCRFSYPALGGFQRQHTSPEERARYLYSAERLEERFRLFEAITLPGIRAQTDPDFTFLVVIGDDFPQRKRLETLLADVPQAVIRAYPPRPHREVMREAINTLRNPDAALSLQFRLDDDDAVNIRFVARLKRVARECRGMLLRQPKSVIDFTHGHLIRPTARGIEAEAVVRLGWPAVAMVFPKGNRMSVMNFAHHTVWRDAPTILLNDPDMYLRGWHPHNDSNFRPEAGLTLLDAAGEARLLDAYGIDTARVRALWGPEG